MDGSFGSRLRSQREQQQVPLSVIAERTKIKASLLEALERDDVSQWPSGIFRRSFVRAYAQAIGLDGDAVLREFLGLYPEPVEEDVASALAAARENRRPPTRLGYLISSAIGALPVLVSGTRGRSATPVMADDAVDGPPAAVAEREAGLGLHVPVVEVPSPATSPMFRVEDEAPIAATAPFPSGETGDAEDSASASAAVAWTSDERLDAPATPSPVGPPCFSKVADLCTRLARVVQPRDVTPVLEDASSVLDAVGLIVWMWDPATRTLGHVLAHGYSSDVLARLPRVRWETDNAIAEAFRSADTRIVRGSGNATGAVVVPIVTAGGCAGVLAMELQDRGEEREWVRAVASILAAQLAALFGFQTLAEAVGA